MKNSLTRRKVIRCLIKILDKREQEANKNPAEAQQNEENKEENEEEEKYSEEQVRFIHYDVENSGATLRSKPHVLILCKLEAFGYTVKHKLYSESVRICENTVYLLRIKNHIINLFKILNCSM